MEFILEDSGDVTVLHLKGDVMGGPEAVQLNTQMHNLLDEKKLQLVLDLAGVNRMNSSGLGILINVLTTYKNNGGQLKLTNVSGRVSNLLEITKLDKIFEIYDSLESALDSF